MVEAYRRLSHCIGMMLIGTLAACAPGVATTMAVKQAQTPAAVITMAANPGAYPGPIASATGDATQAHILNVKATDLARSHLTETAQPTETARPAAPTFPAGAAPCHSADLALTDSTQGATGTIVIQVGLVNVGQTVCYLQGPADIKLADSVGQVLGLGYSTSCFECNNVDALRTALPAAAQTASAQGQLNAKLGLGPGERLGVTLLWNNWCDPLPVGGMKVQLALPDRSGFVEGPTDINFAGRCDVPGAPSTLVGGEYWRVS